MEDEAPDALPAPEAPKKSGTLGLILALGLVTLTGGGAGAMVGVWQFDRLNKIAEQRANAEPTKKENALAWDQNTSVARLDPIIANLAQPFGTWIRVDSAMVFDRGRVEDVERMKAELAESILAFLRTVALHEVQGASAFNHLRDDLNERVRMESSGTVSELLIETMVVQ